MKQITQGLWTMTGLLAGRVYLIEDADGVSIIDTSIAPSGGRILKQLGEIGRTPKDLKRILITHAHPDHVGSLDVLKKETGAQVIASELETPVIEGKIPIPRSDPATLTGITRFMRPGETYVTPVKVDRVVRNGDVLDDVMGGLQVVFTPGHAPGHISFWQPTQKILFCGDVYFNFPSLRPPPGFLTVNMADNYASMKRIVDLAPAMVCFGHGEPLRENVVSRLKAVAEKP